LSTEKAIVCRAIRFSYGKGRKPVYAGYSRDFGPGVTMLKGYSGSGKTTLLKLVGGLLFPQQGSIETTWGAPVAGADYLRLHVGCCFQAMNLLPLATVRRNLEIAGALAGMPRREIRARGEALLERVGILEYADARPAELSGGQQKRAAIARALIKAPSVLLLDEPTSDLDDANAAVIKDILRELRGGVICVMSSHDARMEPVCDTIVNLPDGSGGGVAP
jgi:ABC-type lipoprotein export system ATPase subunit